MSERRFGKESEVRPQRRVVVTGIGAITPLGKSAEESWQNCLSGKSNFIALPYDKRFRSRVASVVDFDLGDYFSGRELAHLKSRAHRSVQFSLVAVGQALSDAGLLKNGETLLEDIDDFRIGARIGTGIGGADQYVDVYKTIDKKGADRVDPASILRILPERTVSVPSMKYGLKAWTASSTTACATGAGNTADAAVLIQANKADIMVCGGTEAAISPVMVAGFANMGALSISYNEKPNNASRPFDSARDGFVPGEGAVILVLEELNHALNREAKIYAELAGMWSSADAKNSVQPDPDNVAKTIEFALADAGVDKDDVDLIVAHATSTYIGDLKEIEALRKVFGEKLSRIPITAPKSSFGHLLGAAGSLTAMIAIKAINEDRIPPTINVENLGEEFTDLYIVRGRCEDREINVAVANAFGFGGLNTVLVFRRFQP